MSQFGANLFDSTIFQSKSDLTSISGMSCNTRKAIETSSTEFSCLCHTVLEGEYVSVQDAENLSHQASFYTAVYGQASLLLGLLFRAAPDDLRKRVALVRDNSTGGAGTILGIFGSILMSITTLILDDATDTHQLESTYSWLLPLSHSKLLALDWWLDSDRCVSIDEDFQAISHMIRALEVMKDARQKVRPWHEIIECVEDALVRLEETKSHIFAGKS